MKGAYSTEVAALGIALVATIALRSCRNPGSNSGAIKKENIYV